MGQEDKEQDLTQHLTQNLTEEQFISIMDDEDIKVDIKGGCNALEGLKIINKYLPNTGVEGASHDVIYSADIIKLIEAGVTKEDVVLLRRLNWMIEDEEYLACFV